MTYFYCTTCQGVIDWDQVDVEVISVDNLVVKEVFSHAISVKLDPGSDEIYDVTHNVTEEG